MENRNYNNCSNCLHQPNPVPFIVHESAMSRMERINKRLWVTIVLLVLLLTATNGLWVWYESQFSDEIVTTQIEQDSESNGRNYIVGGDFFDGAAESDSDENNP